MRESGRRIILIMAATAALLSVAGCGSATPAAGGGGQLKVVAGENFWGSLASQLGGTHASVTSIVSNPNVDPHEYESSPSDARTFATADYVILNGAGYDDWATHLLQANPSSQRRVLIVSDLLGKKAGDNPHLWYKPDWVDQVVSRITADLKSLDRTDASYFDGRQTALRTALGPYHQRVTAIRDRFKGVAVGSTESIFVYMADALGLNLISPPGFMQAIAEDNDPSARDLATFTEQVRGRLIRVLVYNSQAQNRTTENLRQIAVQQGIRVVGISETVVPPGASFQAWQVAQLDRLQEALSAGQ